MDMELNRTNNGGHKLCYNGFIYNKHRQTATHIYWRCSNVSARCNGRLNSSLAISIDNLLVLSQHNHDADHRNVEVTKVRATVKELAATTDTKPAQILARVTATVEDTQAFLPQADVCKRTIRNERARQIPQEPATLRDLVIDGDWALTLRARGHYQ